MERERKKKESRIALNTMSDVHEVPLTSLCHCNDIPTSTLLSGKKDNHTTMSENPGVWRTRSPCTPPPMATTNGQLVEKADRSGVTFTYQPR
jgi:hypothetical protein